MNQSLINQLRKKHLSALSCLTLIEQGDADKKNIAGQWYESLLIDIVEIQVPENEKPEYFNLDWDAHNEQIDELFADTDYTIADQQERSRMKIRVAMHEDIFYNL